MKSVVSKHGTKDEKLLPFQKTRSLLLGLTKNDKAIGF